MVSRRTERPSLGFPGCGAAQASRLGAALAGPVPWIPPWPWGVVIGVLYPIAPCGMLKSNYILFGSLVEPG